jgi:hypothetical protein
MMPALVTTHHQKTTSDRAAHKTEFAPARRLAWPSIEARKGGRRFLSGIIGRARLPALSRPPQPRRSPRAVSRYRTRSPGARTLPARAVGRSVPVECHRCIPSRAVIRWFPSAHRPAGTPVAPNVRASLRNRGAAPRPKINGFSTTRFRLRFSLGLRCWACNQP